MELVNEDTIWLIKGAHQSCIIQNWSSAIGWAADETKEILEIIYYKVRNFIDVVIFLVLKKKFIIFISNSQNCAWNEL